MGKIGLALPGILPQKRTMKGVTQSAYPFAEGTRSIDPLAGESLQGLPQKGAKGASKCTGIDQVTTP